SARLVTGVPAGLLVAVGTPVAWDGRGWTIVNVGETTTVLLAATGTLVELPSDQFAGLVHQGKLTGLADQAEPGRVSGSEPPLPADCSVSTRAVHDHLGGPRPDSPALAGPLPRGRAVPRRLPGPAPPLARARQP